MTRIVALTVFLLLVGFAPASSEAAEARPRSFGYWAKAEVDVYSTVSEEHWQVARAIRKWNKADAAVSMRLVDAPCEHCITVTKMSSPTEFPWQVSAFADLWGFPETGVLDHCTVKVRPSERSKDGIPGVTAHELGHCLGLKHVKSRWSLMGQGVWDLMEPQPIDLERLERLYPPLRSTQ